MTFLKLSEIIQECQLSLPTFGHLLMLLPRVTEPKLVVISLLALKWQHFKVEALVFSSISLNKNSDNFKKVILLYVYYMGYIDFCYRVYAFKESLTFVWNSQSVSISQWKVKNGPELLCICYCILSYHCSFWALMNASE